MPELNTAVIPREIGDASPPMVATTDAPACDLCGSEDAADGATGYDYELLTCSNRWRFVVCRRCGHCWLNPRPAAEALPVIYPPTYYAYNYERISAIARKGKEVLDAGKLRSILRISGGTPARYLDVGCGDGRYLEAMARRGAPRSSLSGLELDDTVVAGLRQRGFDAYREPVESCSRFGDATFDLITMFHVIEHVASPRATVERMAGWLAPGGVLAIETPNLDSLDARLFASGTWGGFHIPRHWHLFTPATLTRMLESVGLEVETIRFQTGHAFWMYSLHHQLRYADPPRPRLARFFDPFSSVPPLVLFTAFDRARASLGAKTSAMLAVARRPA